MTEINFCKEMLSSKCFEDDEKLVLGLIMESEIVRFNIPRFYETRFPCKLTATEMGKHIGRSREKVTTILEKLEENGWITSSKYPEQWARETLLTNKFYHAIGLYKTETNDE